MKEYLIEELLTAKKSLVSTLRRIEKAVVSLEEKQANGSKNQSQITLSKNRVAALNLSLDLIERELDKSYIIKLFLLLYNDFVLGIIRDRPKKKEVVRCQLQTVLF